MFHPNRRRAARTILTVAALGALAWAAQAAPFAAQLRFNIQPGAADPAWSKAGVTFQKSGECVYSASPTPSTAWPVSPGLVRGGGKATAPLFNPGFAQPDGGYLPNSNDDGFNTLFYPAEAAPGALTIVCRGTILANGKDVTAEPGRMVSQTLASVGAAGPPTVSPKLDPQKLTMALPLPPNRPPASGGGRSVAPKVFKQGAGVAISDDGKVDIDGDGNPDIGLHDFKPSTEGIAIAFRTMAGAQITGPKAQRGAAGCKAAAYPGGAQFVYQGGWYCVKTTAGFIAEFQVVSATTAGETATVKVSYTVWEK